MKLLHALQNCLEEGLIELLLTVHEGVCQIPEGTGGCEIMLDLLLAKAGEAYFTNAVQSFHPWHGSSTSLEPRFIKSDCLALLQNQPNYGSIRHSLGLA